MKQLEEILGKDRLITNKDLFPNLTLRTKTKAQYYFEAKSRADLVNAYRAALKLKLPFLLLGGGSNLAVISKTIKGLVIRNLYQHKEVVKGDEKNVEISISSGYPVTFLINELTLLGYAGLEYHLGLPGTVGGALYMNSKWTRPPNYFGDHLLYAFLLDKNGNVKKVDRDYFQFGYDSSVLQKTKEILLEAVFRLKKEKPEVLKERALAALNYRKDTQPFGVASSGCFFRNISEGEKKRLNLSTSSAGYLIDRAGLKGYTVGSFFISPKHANFILNKGQGNQRDLKKILADVKAKVRKKFGVELEEEVLVI